jgi:predicted nucleic acid-binding protein
LTLPEANPAVVVDASALFTVVDDAGVRGDEIAAAIASRTIFVPTIAEYEVTNVIRRYQAAQRFDDGRATRLYRRFRAVPLRAVGFEYLAERIWELRHALRTADAAYVALAEMLDAELLTTAAHLRGAPGLRCPVVVFDREDPPTST